MMHLLLILSGLSAGFAIKTASQATVHMRTSTELSKPNPMRYIVEMLEDLRAKAKKRQEEDDEYWEEFECRFKPMLQKQTELVQKLGAGLPGMQLQIEELEAEIAVLKRGIKKQYDEKASQEMLLQEAEKIRKREKDAYDDFAAEAEQNLFALEQAQKAVEDGLKGIAPGVAFLQRDTKSADRLRNLVVTQNLTGPQRRVMSAFLQAAHTGKQEFEDPATTSYEVTAVMKQMKGTMSAELEEAKALENKLAESFMEAKKRFGDDLDKIREYLIAKRIEYTSKSTKKLSTQREYDELLNGGYRHAKNELTAMNEEFSEAAKDYDARTKSRTEEVAALTQAIQVLNSDESLAVFKRTLPTPDFLQVQGSRDALMQSARSALRKHLGKHDWRIDLLALSMHSGKAVDFKKIVKKIDDMVKLLKAEQKNDDYKRRECMQDLDDAGAERRSLRRQIAEMKGWVGVSQTDVDTTKELMSATKKERDELDYEVVEAGEARKKENTLYMEEDRDNMEATRLISNAKHALTSFYLKEGASFVQGHQSQKPGQVMVILEGLLVDLQATMKKDHSEERKLQLEYGYVMADTKEERLDLTKRLAHLEEDLADHERWLTSDKAALVTLERKFEGNTHLLDVYHADCDWLLKNHEARKDARASEIESLKTASLVLRGGDVSTLTLVQKGQARREDRGLLRGR